ncbi:hypothetical protein NDU88_004094 [Pleurodeles waltl]|uniref:Uncharacterized protein n=1 Tax=Pleurodeles waltl TaxID=8319 RepID=A0AAV7V098_PLEWA|nr:hypothetical protein NDU88_004094 [Pleurodeles waltl]
MGARGTAPSGTDSLLRQQRLSGCRLLLAGKSSRAPGARATCCRCRAPTSRCDEWPGLPGPSASLAPVKRHAKEGAPAVFHSERRGASGIRFLAKIC